MHEGPRCWSVCGFDGDSGALVSVRCQTACVVNRRLRSCRGQSRSTFLVQVCVHQSCQFAFFFFSYCYYYLFLHRSLTLNNIYQQDAWHVTHEFLHSVKAYCNLPSSPLSHTPKLTPHPFPCGLGTYGLAGQEMRETCQPVVLSKHIFYFSLSFLSFDSSCPLQGAKGEGTDLPLLNKNLSSPSGGAHVLLALWREKRFPPNSASIYLWLAHPAHAHSCTAHARLHCTQAGFALIPDCFGFCGGLIRLLFKLRAKQSVCVCLSCFCV